MNYKDIVNILKTISDSNALIASFEEGIEVNHIDSIDFPQLFLQHPVTNSYTNVNGQGNKSISFTFLVLDKQPEDISQIVNLQTKTEIILESVITNLNTILKQVFKGSAITSVSAVPFRNGYIQNCVGYIVEVSIDTYLINSKCESVTVTSDYPCLK